MTAQQRAQEVHLFGPPRNTAGVVAIDTARSGVVPISLRLAKDDTIFRARLRRVSRGVSELRLRLPRQTPPGVYRGQGRVGDHDIAVAVEVEAKPRVRIHPRETRLSGPPGGNADFEVTVVNQGNVPLVVPSLLRFDLDDEDGQERVLGRTSRATLKEGEGRADRFFEEIRVEHGGEAAVRVVSGAGTVAAGDERVLKCQLEIPKEASEGHTYLGAWDLGIAEHGIIVDVDKRGGSKPRGRKK